MSTSIRQWIIQILGNDFAKIQIANGYNYDVKEVFKNYVEATQNELPILYFELVPEKSNNSKYESRNFQETTLQVLIGAYVQYDENNPANINVSAEKILADIDACLYQFKSQSTVLNTFPSKISWDISNVDPYLNPQLSGIVEVRLLLEIEYLKSKDVLLLINTDLPDAPTLTSPSNGSEAITLYPQFEWNSVNGALSYQILISSNSSFNSNYINQNYLITNSYTVPLDKVLTNGNTYYWKVRAYNNNGYGDWSSTFSFDVESSEVVPLDWNEITGSNGWWNSYSATGNIISSGVSALLDQIGSRRLSQATSTRRPSLSANAYGSVSSIYFNPTFASESDCLSYNDTGSAFKWGNTTTGSLIFVMMSDGTNFDYNSGYFCPFARSNTSFGQEFALLRGVNTGPAGYTLGYPFPSGDYAQVPYGLNEPQHLIITHSGSSSLFYLNGRKTNQLVKVITNFTTESNSYVNLGAVYSDAPSYANGRFTGHIFEAGFNSTVLTQAQVSASYEKFKNRFNL